MAYFLVVFLVAGFLAAGAGWLKADAELRAIARPKTRALGEMENDMVSSRCHVKGAEASLCKRFDGDATRMLDTTAHGPGMRALVGLDLEGLRRSIQATHRRGRVARRDFGKVSLAGYESRNRL